MSRSVSEWIGANADAKIPARVRARVFLAQDGKCAECGMAMARCGKPFEVDHTTPLILGGENREANLRALCQPCHKSKTAADVAQKSTEARKRAKHLGLTKPKSTLPGSKDSKWKQKIGGGWVRRDQ